jgi:hypothetical protein
MHEADGTGFALGGAHGATLGAATGGSYGNQPTSTYRARLTAPDGRRTDLTAIESLSLVREVSAVSDIEVTIPRGPDLAAYRFANLDLFYGNDLLFQALVERLPGPGTDAQATLAGRGIGRQLARGEISVAFDGATDHEAIAETWAKTAFRARVTPPDNPGTVTLEATDTPVSILQKLHTQAGMAFVVRHDEPGRVAESFVPDENVRSASWQRVDDDSELDLRDYGNKIIVKGKTADDGTRPRATATDSAEVDLAGREIEWPIEDPELTTTAACQERADTELAERTAEDSLSGTIDIVPTRLDPGYHYRIPAWDDAELPVTSVEYDIARGEAGCRLTVNGPSGIADYLAVLGRDRDTLQRNV